MRQRFARFMYGRNGADELFRIMSYVSIILLLVSVFLPAGFRDFVLVIAVALMIYTYYRVFSKNLAARREENAKFLRFKTRMKEKGRLRRDMWKQRKEYKFFKCPSCKSVMRVPRGKGSIRIVCRKCGTAFQRKT